MTPIQQLADALPKDPANDSPEQAELRAELAAGSTLDEFTAEVLDTLVSFRGFWANGRTDAPDLYPERMLIADWWEQFGDHEDEL